MESCVALWLKVLCAAVLIPVLRANGQDISTEDPPTTQNSTTPTQTLGRSYQVANASTVTIEAMCSPNSAGLKWTARSGYTISVGFSCTSDNVELTVDRCFKMDGTVFIIPQLTEPFKTHIIGTELEPGTVCTFHATTRDISDRTMDTVSASCTVENSNPPLPANCNVLSDTQQCQCSCNPGFTGSTGSNAFFECESTDLPTTQGNMATTVQLSMTPTQSVGQVADSSTVTIEAMCSSNSAGLKWTVPDETGTGAYTISVGFRCASDLDEVNDDRCFKKDGTVFIIPQLVEPFKTHIIGTELEPGTVCTFHATTKTFSPESDIDTVTASCTVGDSNPPLPANCTVLSDTQQCECSCNPGFTESTGPTPSFECEATNTFKPSKTPTLNSSSIQKTPVVTSTGGPSTTAVPTPSPFVTQSSPHSPTPYLYLLPAMSVVIISVCALVSVLVFFGMRRYRDHKKKWASNMLCNDQLSCK